MVFKLLVLTVACFALLAQPAQSGEISDVLRTLSRIVTLGPRTVIEKGRAAGRLAADMASIATMGAGIEVSELGKSASSFKGAVANGLYTIGRSISNAGNTNTGDFSSLQETNTFHPSYIEIKPGDVSQFGSEEGEEYKIRPSKIVYRAGPPVLRIRKYGAGGRGHGRRFINVRRGVIRRPTVYDIIYTPRVYPGPRGTFFIQKK